MIMSAHTQHRTATSHVTLHNCHLIPMTRNPRNWQQFWECLSCDLAPNFSGISFSLGNVIISFQNLESRDHFVVNNLYINLFRHQL